MIISTQLLIPSIGKTDTASEMQQGLDYVKFRIYQRAVDSFKSVLSRNPTDVNALYHLGNVYKLQNELDLAIETYIGKKINRSGIGTKIKVVTGNLSQYREVQSGGSYLSFNDLRAHFGVGKAEQIDLLEIHWTSGQIDKSVDVSVNQRLLAVEREKNRYNKKIEFTITNSIMVG